MAVRHLKRWAVGGIALVALVALGVGGPFLFIHLVEGPTRPELALPRASAAAGSGATSAALGSGAS